MRTSWVKSYESYAQPKRLVRPFPHSLLLLFSSPNVYFRNSDTNHTKIESNGSARTRQTRKSSDGVPSQQGYTKEVDRDGRLDGEEEINTWQDKDKYLDLTRYFI